MKAFLKIIGLLLGGIVVLAAIAIGVGTALGYIYGGTKQPAQAVRLHTTVCETADIEKYNKFVTTLPTNEEEQKQKAADMQVQVDALKKKEHFDQDPTCVFIAYSAAVAASNVNEAQSLHDALADFSAKGIFPSNKLLDVVSLDSMQARIEGLKNVDASGLNPMGSG